MKECKHCRSRYPEAKGRGEFCCAGCEHVYGMIHGSGLGDYYRQQDRVGQPVGDRPFSDSDFDYVAIKQVQTEAENAGECKASVSIKGMSCLGCAWLIEQLSKRHRGVRFAKVALDANLLSLEWERGDFDLCALAEDLHKFGYGMSGDVASAGYGLSPLAMRCGLTLVFSLNGLLLSLAAGAGIGGEGLRQLYKLLIVLCLLFALFIGGSLFLRPVWGALRLHRVHSDALPAFILLGLFALALVAVLFSAFRMLPVALYFILLPAMVLARWLSQIWALKTPPS